MTREPSTTADALALLFFLALPIAVAVGGTIFGALMDSARHTVETFTNQRGNTP
jgi:hypothetical protein